MTPSVLTDSFTKVEEGDLDRACLRCGKAGVTRACGKPVDSPCNFFPTDIQELSAARHKKRHKALLFDSPQHEASHTFANKASVTFPQACKCLAGGTQQRRFQGRHFISIGNFLADDVTLHLPPFIAPVTSLYKD